jgi:hypothetical protein
MMLSKLYVSIFDQEAWMVRRDWRPGFRTYFESIYNLANVYITMEHHHAINGIPPYFYGQFP